MRDCKRQLEEIAQKSNQEANEESHNENLKQFSRDLYQEFVEMIEQA